jgi:hypothetical protein
MRTLSGNSEEYRRRSAVVLTTTLASILALASAARSTEARIIDIRGRQIPSVFHNLPPNPEFAQLRSAAQEKASICPKATTRSLVFHESDHSFKLRKVQQDCQGHRMRQNFPGCSFCGGNRGWTDVDPNEPWDIGYYFDYTGCNTGNCTQEYTCINSTQ